MEKVVQLHDKRFKEVIPYEEVQQAVIAVAAQINSDYKEKKQPLFLGVLSGSFVFMGELMRHIEFACEVSFIKLSSYSGTASTGTVTETIGLSEELTGRDVIIVEDIVDTGKSYDYLAEVLEKQQPTSVAIATLLFKPDAYTIEREVHYRAFSIEDRFIVGCGLDYNQLGRNLNGIYELIE